MYENVPGNFNANVRSEDSLKKDEHEIFFRNLRMFLCIALGAAGAMGAVFGFWSSNSVYLKAFSGFRDGLPNLLPFNAYYLINLAAFLCLSVFAFICAGSEIRYEKLDAAKAAYKREKGGYTDIAKERVNIKNISSCEKRIKTAKAFMILFAIFAIILFVGLFIVSGLARTVIELSRKPVDRDDGDLRVMINCISQGLLTFAAVFGVLTIPVFLRRGKKPNVVFLIVCFILCAVPVVHYAYFYFGNITAHPSPMDLAAFLVPLIICGFSGVYFAEKRREKVLSSLRQ